MGRSPETPDASGHWLRAHKSLWTLEGKRALTPREVLTFEVTPDGVGAGCSDGRRPALVRSIRYACDRGCGRRPVAHRQGLLTQQSEPLEQIWVPVQPNRAGVVHPRAAALGQLRCPPEVAFPADVLQTIAAAMLTGEVKRGSASLEPGEAPARASRCPRSRQASDLGRCHSLRTSCPSE